MSPAAFRTIKRIGLVSLSRGRWETAPQSGQTNQGIFDTACLIGRLHALRQVPARQNSSFVSRASLQTHHQQATQGQQHAPASQCRPGGSRICVPHSARTVSEGAARARGRPERSPSRMSEGPVRAPPSRLEREAGSLAVWASG